MDDVSYQDDVDVYCRRVPQAVRQLILDYHIMGMRPREILSHVGDLSWADLQERDKLLSRLRHLPAHDSQAEPANKAEDVLDGCPDVPKKVDSDANGTCRIICITYCWPNY